MTRRSRALRIGLIGSLISACGYLAIGAEAPPECGFPDGTPLSFAGRSTTAALGVNEVDGDAMSSRPADIFVTRDPFSQGELDGRLVCAIYVDPPGFVEVTVHPDDVVRPDPRPAIPPGPPADGASREDAVEKAWDELAILVAKDPGELPGRDEWELEGASAMPISEFLPGYELEEWAQDLPAEQWVWIVFLRSGDQGAEVVMDYLDLTVLQVMRSIID